MPDTDELTRISQAVAAAISARDTATLAGFLAPDFVHRTPGGEDRQVDSFLQGIAQIPGEIIFVKVEDLRVDVSGGSAIVSGIQRAQVRIEDCGGTPAYTGPLPVDRRGRAGQPPTCGACRGVQKKADPVGSALPSG